MSVALGSRLGPYEITGKLGEGGMGEVYRATDSRLKREVAIKVLPPGFTADPERLARFEREAQLLAQLHHPNIASIFGVEEQDGIRALVMELVDGPTLAERMGHAPLPPEEALAIALQIALALEAAHEKGIVHRDLKPQNVKVRADGAVKVLDFGLAKAMDAATGSGSPADLARSPTLMHSPTLSAAYGTHMGVILGTAAYMAPEQAKGMGVDRRADIWAFGVVLFEMLAGGSLFAGDSVGDTLAAVIRADIDLDRLPAGTPLAIRQLLRRCLERTPRNRLHDIADARIVLEEVLAGKLDEAPASAPAAAAIAPPARRRWLPPLAALAAGLAVGALAFWWLGRARGEQAAPPLTQLELRLPEGTGSVHGLALSPDGRKLALSVRGADGKFALWVRALDRLEAHQVPETAGARYPFWAPDSRRLGYFSPRGLSWIDTAGGSPFEVAPTATLENVRGASWGADDVILYTPDAVGAIFAVSAKGGKSVQATRLPAANDIGTTRFPTFLPDGRRFVFYAAAGTGTEPGFLYLGRLGSLAAKLLGPANSQAVYAEPGYLLYARGESMVAQRLDDRREELVGEPAPLGFSLGSSLNVSGLRSLAAAGGVLVYRNDRRGTSELVVVDRSGHDLETLADSPPTWHYGPRLSPDGNLLAVAHLEERSGFGEVWIHDLTRKLATRLSSGDADDYVGAWVRPGSREIIFTSSHPNAPGVLYRAALDRPGEARPWLTGNGRNYQQADAVSYDGQWLLFDRPDAVGKVSLWLARVDGQGEPRRLSAGTASESTGDLSPDGLWIAYVSDATRHREVYVRPLDGTGAAIRISNDGGAQPIWRRDGRELFYVDDAGRLVAVAMAAGASLQPGVPQPLFAARLEESTDRQYDAFADGQRFLLNRAQTSDDAPTVVVVGWHALLDRKAAGER